MKDTNLLATFVKSGYVKSTLKEIAGNFNVVSDKAFLLKDLSQKNKYIISYNIFVDENTKFTNISENTISLHRKKEFNVLYSLNALNEVIKLQNDGVLDESFIVNWNDYKNSILLSKSDDRYENLVLKEIKTKLISIVDLKEYVTPYNENRRIVNG